MQRSLLEWYDANKRDLPWRRTNDPYTVLVSEVMCQQTRVDVVISHFERWMARWPTLGDLAVAPEEDVIAQWSGLGYYRRARNLHAAAKEIVANGWPENLQALPGVGPYIAGALASIAFGRPVPAVDGNVQRVLSRLGDIHADVTKAAGRNAVTDLAQQLVHVDRPGDWTQAVMELGATVCTPTSPECDACPVNVHCQTQEPDALPVKTAKPAPVRERMHFAVIEEASRVLLVRRPNDRLLGGTWALPGGEVDTPLEDWVKEQTGITVRVSEAIGEAVHVFSHRHWTMRVHEGERLESDHGPNVRWVHLDELHTVGLSTAMRKALQAAPRAVPKAH